jgi:hypothetical protein
MTMTAAGSSDESRRSRYFARKRSGGFIAMSAMVMMSVVYLCRPALGMCDLARNEGKPVSYERSQDCLAAIKRMPPPTQQGAAYYCLKVKHDESLPAGWVPEHIPLNDP